MQDANYQGITRLDVIKLIVFLVLIGLARLLTLSAPAATAAGGMLVMF